MTFPKHHDWSGRYQLLEMMLIVKANARLLCIENRLEDMIISYWTLRGSELFASQRPYLLQGGEVLSQDRIQPPVHEILKGRQIVLHRCMLKCIEVGFSVFRSYSNRWIPAAQE